MTGLKEPLLLQAEVPATSDSMHNTERPLLIIGRQLTFDADGAMLAPVEDSFRFPASLQQQLLDEEQAVQQLQADEQGLLQHNSTNGTPAHPHSQSQKERSTFAWTVLQMSKVILGSGMLVLPKAFRLLGCAMGIGLLTGVGVLTWFTVHGLVYAADRLGKKTYASTVRLSCGRPAKWGLLAAVFANCFGMCVVFLVIYGDILPIILQEIWPGAADITWLMNRNILLAAVTVILLLPFSAQRDLNSLSILALVGVASVAIFALASMLLAAAAFTHGTWQSLPWLPDWDALARGGNTQDDAVNLLGPTATDNAADMLTKAATDGGNDSITGGLAHNMLTEAAMARSDGDLVAGMDLHVLGSAGLWQPLAGSKYMPLLLSTRHNTAISIILGIAGVTPLLLNADICHQSIFPAMTLLQPYSRRAFNSVMAIALTLCNSLYTIIALCCLSAFGPDVDDNVLNNMTAVGMAPLLGTHGAQFVSLLVKLMYFVSLLGSFVFVLHPLRHCCLEVLLGSNFPTKKQAKANRLFLPITIILLVAIYLTAVVVPGIWQVLSLVGSSASTFMGFVFPALVILVTERKPKWTHRLKKVCAVFVIALGLFLFVNGFALQLLGPSGN